MQTGSIKAGDLLCVEIRGYQFFARAKDGVTEWNGRRGIELLPLDDHHRLYAGFATSRQIVGIYSKRKGSR